MPQACCSRRRPDRTTRSKTGIFGDAAAQAARLLFKREDPPAAAQRVRLPAIASAYAPPARRNAGGMNTRTRMARVSMMPSVIR